MNASFEDFKKLELRIGIITEAERVEHSDKLLRLQVTIGDETRQIIAGIGTQYDPSSLTDKEIVLITNLEPRMIMGLESQGMVLAASGEEGPVLLQPERHVDAGSEVR